MTILVPIKFDHLDILTLVVLICFLLLRLIIEGLLHLITSVRLLFFFRFLFSIVNFLIEPLVCLLNGCNFGIVKLHFGIFLFSLFFLSLLIIFIICIFVHLNINVVTLISPFLLILSFFIVVSSVFQNLVLFFLIFSLSTIALGGLDLCLSLFLLILLLLLFICNRSLIGGGDLIAIGVNFFLQRVLFLNRLLLLLFHVDWSVVTITLGIVFFTNLIRASLVLRCRFLVLAL